MEHVVFLTDDGRGIGASASERLYLNELVTVLELEKGLMVLNPQK